MLYAQLLSLIPIVLAGVWALVSIIKTRQFSRVLCVLGLWLFLLVDIVIIVLHLHHDEITTPLWVDYVQIVAGCSLLPLMYLYFMLLLGKATKSRTVAPLFVLIIFTALPNMVVFLDGFSDANLAAAAVTKRFMLNFIQHGESVFAIRIDSLIVIVQMILVLFKLGSFIVHIHKIELVLTRHMRLFLDLSMVTVIFIALTFAVPWEFWLVPTHSWFLVIGIMIVTTIQTISVGYNRNLSAVMTAGESEPVKLDEYVKFNSDLASRARHILDGEKLYLQPGIVIDQVVEMLGTNRTYFTRMMRIEFGQTFNEYVNNKRLKYSQNLLLTTDKSLNEIAEESGFGSASAYCRVFKRLTDTTPEVWRNTNLSK